MSRAEATRPSPSALATRRASGASPTTLSRRYIFVSLEYPPAFGGGIGTYVSAMTRILASQGHEVTVLSVTESPAPTRERLDIGPHGLEVIRVPLPQGTGEEPGWTLSVWNELSQRFAGILNKIVRHAGGPSAIDAIEFPDYRGEGLAYLSGTPRSQRPPCIIRLHTPCVVLSQYNRARTNHGVLEAFEVEAMRLADQLVSPSQALVNELERLCTGLPPMRVLPYPSDPMFLGIDPESERSKLGISHDEDSAREILYVGRLEERKGVETLIAAAPQILANCPKSTLHLVGGDLFRSPDQPSMLRHLQTMIPPGYRDRIVFHGRIPREDLIERYLRARVCVFPSLFENFPNTCLESMALARPTIGTDNSGMAEMIEHGVTGVIARSGDIDSLSRSVVELYRAPVRARARMGAAARESVSSRYQPELIGHEYVRVMSEASGRKATPRSFVPRPSLAARRSLATRPGVAVVIPCFNHGAFIRETIASVRKQTVAAQEIIVVNDGSTDRATLEVLEGLPRLGARVIHQENRGLAAARNAGIRASNTEYFVPLDADDCIEPEFIEKLQVPLKRTPTLGYCYSHVRYFGAVTGEWKCPQYEAVRLLVGNLSVATALVRREAFDLTGGYDESLRKGFEDWAFWLSLLSMGYHGFCVPEPLFRYRKHSSGSMLTSTQQARSEILHQLITGHPELFSHNLPWALVEKDRMFFDDHLRASRSDVELGDARERIAYLERRLADLGHPERAPASARQNIEPQVVVRELDSLLRSRTYRTITRLKELPVYRAYADRRYGPGWESHHEIGSPEERLQRIRNSRGYKVMVTLKKTPVYKVWANWHYGQKAER